MADIDTAFVKQFGSNIQHLVQQKGSRLRGAVMLKPGVTGEEAYFDQLGATTAVKRTSRHADTPITTPDHKRRRVTMYDWEHAVLLDKQDQLKLLIDPASSYSVNGMWALGRAIDTEILTQAFATAYTGKEGGTTQTFTAANQIAAAATGLTIAKLLEAKELLDASDVDEEEPRYIAVTAKQVTDLLNLTEVKSSDYNTVKALAAGQIDTFMGFKFIRTQLVPVDGSSDRRVLVWAQSGIGLALAQEITSRVTERADKSYSLQVYLSMGLGATRVEEAKCVEIKCTES